MVNENWGKVLQSTAPCLGTQIMLAVGAVAREGLSPLLSSAVRSSSLSSRGEMIHGCAPYTMWICIALRPLYRPSNAAALCFPWCCDRTVNLIRSPRFDIYGWTVVNVGEGSRQNNPVPLVGGVAPMADRSLQALCVFKSSKSSCEGTLAEHHSLEQSITKLDLQYRRGYQNAKLEPWRAWRIQLFNWNSAFWAPHSLLREVTSAQCPECHGGEIR